MTKIILLPGFPDFTNLGITFLHGRYFRDVPAMLQSRGFEVFNPEVGPFGTTENRARMIAAELESHGVFADERKAHIIAHSAGGLDARYLVSPDAPRGPQLGSRIRSITTISTPHRGTPIADLVNGGFKSSEAIIPILKEKFPNLEDGVRGLTTLEMADFNKAVHNAEEVKYFSYAGVLGHERILEGSIFAVTQPLFVFDGANDGWVSFRSAHWGEFKATIRADHAEEIGYDLAPPGIFPFGFGGRTFDHLELYRRIADDIAALGDS
jgi:triacylglycerol lipase